MSIKCWKFNFQEVSLYFGKRSIELVIFACTFLPDQHFKFFFKGGSIISIQPSSISCDNLILWPGVILAIPFWISFYHEVTNCKAWGSQTNSRFYSRHTHCLTKNSLHGINSKLSYTGPNWFATTNP